MFASGLKTVALELLGDVTGGELAALLVHAATFELVAGEIFDVTADFVWVHFGREDPFGKRGGSDEHSKREDQLFSLVGGSLESLMTNGHF